MSVKIAASILSADFARLGEQVQEAIDAGAEIIHVDIMDGHFVPNMTIGPVVVSAIKPIAQAAGVVLDVHLMIEAPDRLVPEFTQAGADVLIVHVETCPHLHRTVQMI
jgi:ribulose-phosphate 3-epimerase